MDGYSWKMGVLCVIAIVLSRMNDAWLLHDVPNVFSFKGALNQLPYFFAGVAAQRFAVQLYSRSNTRVMYVMAFLGIFLINAVWFSDKLSPLCILLYPLTQIPTLFLLLSISKHNRFFVWIGGYAYSIYLFHGFGTSGAYSFKNDRSSICCIDFLICEFYSCVMFHITR